MSTLFKNTTNAGTTSAIEGPGAPLPSCPAVPSSAVDRIVVVAAAGDALPLVEDVADLLNVPESRVAGAVVLASESSKAA